MATPSVRHGARWWDISRLPFWFGLLLIAWLGLGGAAYRFPSVGATLVGAAVGATVSIFVYLANRGQARRQTTLDLLTEYYSPDFAAGRRGAERFMAGHATIDWSIADPYVAGAGDPDLAGYSAVVRYWQRVAILDLEGELRSDLARRLLAREVGYWNAILFEPMSKRPNMYVRALLAELVSRFSKGPGRAAFEAGESAGRSAPPRNDEAARSPS